MNFVFLQNRELSIYKYNKNLKKLGSLRNKKNYETSNVGSTGAHKLLIIGEYWNAKCSCSQHLGKTKHQTTLCQNTPHIVLRKSGGQQENLELKSYVDHSKGYFS